MKKILLVLMMFTATATFAQGLSVGISGGYLSELDGFGGSGDVIYNFDDKFAVATNATYAVAEEGSTRAKWFAVDLNGHYKLIEEFYLLAGGQYLSITLKELGLGGGSINPATQVSGNDFGINVGSGYKYNLVDNVNIFAEAKYVIIETGYFHARIGLQFDF